MHGSRYPLLNLGKIEVSGNAGFLWDLRRFDGRNAKEKDVLADA
jgi:hypothetical protein